MKLIHRKNSLSLYVHVFNGPFSHQTHQGSWPWQWSSHLYLSMHAIFVLQSFSCLVTSFPYIFFQVIFLLFFSWLPLCPSCTLNSFWRAVLIQNSLITLPSMYFSSSIMQYLLICNCAQILLHVIWLSALFILKSGGWSILRTLFVFWQVISWVRETDGESELITVDGDLYVISSRHSLDIGTVRPGNTSKYDLIIANVQPSDAGTYTCMLRNRKGGGQVVSHSLSLTVTESPRYGEWFVMPHLVISLLMKR